MRFIDLELARRVEMAEACAGSACAGHDAGEHHGGRQCEQPATGVASVHAHGSERQRQIAGGTDRCGQCALDGEQA